MQNQTQKSVRNKKKDIRDDFLPSGKDMAKCVFDMNNIK